MAQTALAVVRLAAGSKAEAASAQGDSCAGCGAYLAGGKGICRCPISSVGALRSMRRSFHTLLSHTYPPSPACAPASWCSSGQYGAAVRRAIQRRGAAAAPGSGAGSVRARHQLVLPSRSSSHHHQPHPITPSLIPSSSSSPSCHQSRSSHPAQIPPPHTQAERVAEDAAALLVVMQVRAAGGALLLLLVKVECTP